jgi:hypothetical protein
MTLMTIPKIWKSETCYIIGGGASLNKTGLTPCPENQLEINESISKLLTPIHNEYVIGVNNAFELGSWIDICYFGDSRWFEWNRKKLRGWGGLKICTSSGLSERRDIKVVLWSKDNGKDGIPKMLGIDKDPKHVRWNWSSGGAAINIAYHLGVKKIVLIGYDMVVNERGEKNWHNNHVIKDDPKDYDTIYTRFLQGFPVIASDLKNEGVEIINASIDSVIEAFPKVTLEEILGDG